MPIQFCYLHYLRKKLYCYKFPPTSTAYVINDVKQKDFKTQSASDIIVTVMEKLYKILSDITKSLWLQCKII